MIFPMGEVTLEKVFTSIHSIFSFAVFLDTQQNLFPRPPKKSFFLIKVLSNRRSAQISKLI